MRCRGGLVGKVRQVRLDGLQKQKLTEGLPIRAVDERPEGLAVARRADRGRKLLAIGAGVSRAPGGT